MGARSGPYVPGQVAADVRLPLASVPTPAPEPAAVRLERSPLNAVPGDAVHGVGLIGCSTLPRATLSADSGCRVAGQGDEGEISSVGAS